MDSPQQSYLSSKKPPPPLKNHTSIIFFLFIFIGITIVVVSAIFVMRYSTIIKATGIISKVTCVQNTTKQSLYKCELTIQYNTTETVITIENNVKYNVNDTITIYYPENIPSNITLIDMDYKTIGYGGVAVGSFMFIISAIATIST